MKDYRELAQEIESLRKRLQHLIEVKVELSDPEIIGASKMLDALLNEYYELLRTKEKIK